MKPYTDPWNGTGPMLVAAAWVLALVITGAAIVAGLVSCWTFLSRSGK